MGKNEQIKFLAPHTTTSRVVLKSVHWSNRRSQSGRWRISETTSNFGKLDVGVQKCSSFYGNGSAVVTLTTRYAKRVGFSLRCRAWNRNLTLCCQSFIRRTIMKLHFIGSQDFWRAYLTSCSSDFRHLDFLNLNQFLPFLSV